MGTLDYQESLVKKSRSGDLAALGELVSANQDWLRGSNAKKRATMMVCAL